MNKKKSNIFVIALAVIALASCKKESVDYIKDGEELIECVNKLDQSVILYYKSEARLYKPDSLPVSIYYIHDVNGKLFSLNNYEIENYTCSKIENNK